MGDNAHLGGGSGNSGGSRVTTSAANHDGGGCSCGNRLIVAASARSQGTSKGEVSDNDYDTDSAAFCGSTDAVTTDFVRETPQITYGHENG